MLSSTSLITIISIETLTCENVLAFSDTKQARNQVEFNIQASFQNLYKDCTERFLYESNYTSLPRFDFSLQILLVVGFFSFLLNNLDL